MTRVLLISTYELGHQPFGLASPLAWFRAHGVQTDCLDLAVQAFDESLVAAADLIAIYLPMHTATRLAVALIPRLKAINADAHLCCYGLYAPVNENFLRQIGVETIIGGEFEAALVELQQKLFANDLEESPAPAPAQSIFLTRQQFLVPDRGDLPALKDYAQLIAPDGSLKLAGYTEASRGCKHFCRHCPIVPIYNGRFRVVQKDIVLADIRQQVQAGAEHITFGDPDFLNGPGHALPIVESLHKEFPDVTYDVTIKIEHLLKNDHSLPLLKESGCLFVTSAVEAVDDAVLRKLNKGHTQEDFIRVAGRLQRLGLALNPTFVAFTPWTTPRTYLDMLSSIAELGLVANVAPIQYAIRLLIPAGSLLLDLPDIKTLVQPFDPQALTYPWQHPNQAVDALYEQVFRLVKRNQGEGASRETLFAQIWQAVLDVAPELASFYAEVSSWDAAAKPVPALSESWY